MYISSTNILLVVFTFEVTICASLATPPPLKLRAISSGVEILQPRNVILNTITPPIQNIFDYLMKGLSAFSDILAKIFATPAKPPLQKNTTARASENSLPVQNFERDIIVEGNNGNILIDGKTKYYNDGEFEKGQVRVQIRDGNFYVNNNLVAKKASKKVKGIYSMHDLGHSAVTHFELKIYGNGFMEYEDNISAHHRYVNYITWINFR